MDQIMQYKLKQCEIFKSALCVNQNQWKLRTKKKWKNYSKLKWVNGSTLNLKNNKNNKKACAC